MHKTKPDETKARLRLPFMPSGQKTARAILQLPWPTQGHVILRSTAFITGDAQLPGVPTELHCASKIRTTVHSTAAFIVCRCDDLNWNNVQAVYHFSQLST